MTIEEIKNIITMAVFIAAVSTLFSEAVKNAIRCGTKKKQLPIFNWLIWLVINSGFSFLIIASSRESRVVFIIFISLLSWAFSMVFYKLIIKLLFSAANIFYNKIKLLEMQAIDKRFGANYSASRAALVMQVGQAINNIKDNPDPCPECKCAPCICDKAPIILPKGRYNRSGIE